MREFQLLTHLVLVIEFEFRIQHCCHCLYALDCLGYLIHILRLNQRLQVVLKNFGEVVLKLRSTEVFQDFLPVGRILIMNVVGTGLHAKQG